MQKRVFKGVKLALTLLLCALSAAMLFVLRHAPAFSGGETYTLSLGANSSAQMLTLKTPPFVLPQNVKGESTVYEGDRAQHLLTAFRARVLFTEEAANTVSYYCFSPFLGEGLKLNGAYVNLHIAVGEGRTAVGTPVIFGGF